MHRHGDVSRGEAARFVLLCLAIVIVAVYATGCVPRIEIGGAYADQPHLPKKPGQEAAEAVIQQELEQLTGWTPPAPWRMPEVQWIEGAALTCYGNGWFEYWARNKAGSCDVGMPAVAPPTGPGLTSGPACKVCLLGLSLLGENTIMSNWAPDKLQGFHTTSLAHEYCHFFERWATGDGDTTHIGPCYTGPRWVDVVNHALQSAGL